MELGLPLLDPERGLLGPGLELLADPPEVLLGIAIGVEGIDLIDRLQQAQDHLHHLYEDVRGYAAPIRLERRPGKLSAIWREAWADLLSLSARLD